jgi:SAM-dependent methyltransferase
MLPKLYSSFAHWWPLFSPRSDYEEAARVYGGCLDAGWEGQGHPTLLEFGCGGGSNASFLKERFRMTLTDVSPDMLAQSREINPECEHVEGDMRTLRLGRTFDRVFIHDAICFMTTPTELFQAIETAFVHCRAGGVAVFAPDYVRETFRPGTCHGGDDGADRSLRYLEWTWDPDPSDSQYVVDLVYAFRDRGDSIRVEHDRHILGVFGRQEWLRTLRQAGFEPTTESFCHSQVDHPLDLFVGFKPEPI